MVLPLSKSIAGNDGKEITELLVPKGTTIEVAIIRANREPEVWGPDAYEWKPERYATSDIDGSPRISWLKNAFTLSQMVETAAVQRD